MIWSQTQYTHDRPAANGWVEKLEPLAGQSNVLLVKNAKISVLTKWIKPKWVRGGSEHVPDRGETHHLHNFIRYRNVTLGRDEKRGKFGTIYSSTCESTSLENLNIRSRWPSVLGLEKSWFRLIGDGWSFDSVFCIQSILLTRVYHHHLWLSNSEAMMIDDYSYV